jgi:GTP-binding protein YchF
MNLSVGIVGLPNVGKSTLFNALLKKQQALAANYPFATIEPNIGIVPVPDERLTKLAEITKDEEKITSLPPIKPATVEFVDIAGLVKGASEGAGLGNKFLSHIREVSIIAHVVRAFADENVIREGSIDAKSDYLTIETELMLADLQSVQNMQNRIRKDASGDERSALEKLIKALSDGKPARSIELTEEEQMIARQWFLLSAKKELIVLNVAERDYSEEIIVKLIDQYAQLLDVSKDLITVVCAKVEEELAALLAEEQKEYLLR